MVALGFATVLRVLGVVLAAASVQVDGETTCPAPALVKAELAEMLREDVDLRERVFIRDLVDGIGVEVYSPANEELLRRLVPAAEKCGDRARVAAVIVAALLQQIHPEALVGPPPPPPPPPPPTDGREPAVITTPVIFRHDLDLGLGLSASVASGITNLGGTAQLHFFAPTGGLGVHLGLAVDGTREIPFELQTNDDRVARWRRIPITFGPGWRMVRDRWNLDFRFVGVALWTGVEGRNFASSGEASSWAFAGGGGVRASSRSGVIVTWVDLAAFVWPHQQAEVVQVAEVVDLPRFGMLLSVGAGLCTRCQPGSENGKELGTMRHVAGEPSSIAPP